ncbi:MAG: acyl-CoA synthetase FdrA [Candidatus Hodarchaeota archaeon]
MIIKTHIINQEYRDSVQLMRAASAASKLKGIEVASVLMGTPKNKPLLEEVDLLTAEAESAGSNDIIISIRAKNNSYANSAIKLIIDFLSRESTISHIDSHFYRSIRGGITGIPDANLAVISVPGEFAAREARLALEQDLNVLLFSDNVSLDDEIILKKNAHKKGLIVMGPDCGTAMIKNIGLGFSNVVMPGPIGVVAASGTGAQEIITLCHNAGVGVIHVIGTGSRDVKDSIGGISMIDGLRALNQDNSVKLIIIVSKPPEEFTLRKILNEVRNCSKPVIINFLGKKAGYLYEAERFLSVNTLEEAAYSATEYINTKKLKFKPIIFNEENTVKKILNITKSSLNSSQRYIRGLYAGGTFTFESTMIISEILPVNETLWTNIMLKGTKVIDNPRKSKEHTLIDLGADEFTVGKPHPMIDQTERTLRFLEEIKDQETAVILLDFVLGYGSQKDPVGDMKDAFKKWKSLHYSVPIVAHVCGTNLDPQNYTESVQILEDLGIYVMPTNAQAARLATLIAFRWELDELTSRVTV